MKIVLNISPLGFDVSDKVYEYLIEECDWKAMMLPKTDKEIQEALDANTKIFIIDDEYDFVETDLSSFQFRTNPDLVEAVEIADYDAFTETGARACVVDIEDLDYVPNPLIIEVPNAREYVIDIRTLMG